MNYQAPIRIGNRWVFPGGRTLPVVRGADGGTSVADPPVDTSTLDEIDDRAVLDEMESAIVAEFDAAYDARTSEDTPADERPTLAMLEEIAGRLDAVRARMTVVDEQAAEQAAQAAAEDEAAAALAAQVNPPAAEPADDPADDDPADAPADDPAAADPQPVTAATRQAPRTPPSASGVRRAAPTPTPPPVSDMQGIVTITAAADVPGYGNGQQLAGPSDIARALHARANGLRGVSATRYGVASVRTDLPERFMIREDTSKSAAAAAIEAAVQDVLARAHERAASEGVTPARALVASGGWCVPSQTLYDQFSIESATGLLDMPTVGVDRGGLNVPSFFGIGDAAAALWTWTEADDQNTAVQAIEDFAVVSNVATVTITGHGYVVGQSVLIDGVTIEPLANGLQYITAVTANTFDFDLTAGNTGAGPHAQGTAALRKGALRIPCPTWTDYRLYNEGLEVLHGNLMDTAYSELTTRFVNLTMTAHLHRSSNRLLADLIATAAGANTYTHAGATADAAGTLFDAIDLAVADYRSEHLMDENVVLDALFPQHIVEAVRASLSMRAGVDQTNVARAVIVQHLVNRNVRPQFLAGLDPLFSASPATDWPATSRFVLFATGAYVKGQGPTVNLGVVRDSTLNRTNDFTAAWTEQSQVLVQRGPTARVVTHNIPVDGKTGGPTA